MLYNDIHPNGDMVEQPIIEKYTSQMIDIHLCEILVPLQVTEQGHLLIAEFQIISDLC